MDALGVQTGRASAVPLLSPDEAAAGDRAAVDAGATWAGLMERAAGHLARGVVAAAEGGYGRRALFLCGRGNNGGDGWAAARRVAALGVEPWVVAVDGLDADLSEEASENRGRFLDGGGRASGTARLDEALAWCDVGVDCLLGTGAEGAPRGAVGSAVTALVGERRPRRVVACDIPTGVQGADGQVPGDAVRADLTVTFGALKRGLLLHPGAAHAGRVVLGELGSHYTPPDSSWVALTAGGAVLEPSPTDAEKRSRGVVLVVAGSVGMAGAAVLVARGALGVGAGLLTIAVPRSIQDIVSGAVGPALTVGLPEDGGVVSADAASVVAEHAHDSDAVVCGPGMRPTKGTRAVVDTLLEEARTLVLDADGLNVYRDDVDALAAHAGALVLTPHVRELARLAGGDAGQIGNRRNEVALELAVRLHATVLAKGPGTLVAGPAGRVYVNPTGGPALATGGSGDVLAGLLGVLAARITDATEATAKGVWMHGLAGDMAARTSGGHPDSALIARMLPHAVAQSARLARKRPGWPFDAPGWLASGASR